MGLDRPKPFPSFEGSGRIESATPFIVSGNRAGVLKGWEYRLGM